MKEKFNAYKSRIQNMWQEMSKRNKYLLIGGSLLFILSIGIVIYWSTRPNFVPIYTNLSASEAGEIVSAIEAQGIPVELSPDGKNISVPKKRCFQIKGRISTSRHTEKWKYQL